MTSDTFARVLRAFCRRRPFRHFVIEFHTGQLLKIVHPEAIVIQKGDVVLSIEKDEATACLTPAAFRNSWMSTRGNLFEESPNSFRAPLAKPDTAISIP